MNPNYGYQLYQAQRPQSRGEIIFRDAQRGHRAAAARRDGREMAGKARASVTMARNIVMGIVARAAARTA